LLEAGGEDTPAGLDAIFVSSSLQFQRGMPNFLLSFLARVEVKEAGGLAVGQFGRPIWEALAHGRQSGSRPVNDHKGVSED
jgi:hypothetical protein